MKNSFGTQLLNRNLVPWNTGCIRDHVNRFRDLAQKSFSLGTLFAWREIEKLYSRWMLSCFTFLPAVSDRWFSDEEMFYPYSSMLSNSSRLYCMWSHTVTNTGGKMPSWQIHLLGLPQCSALGAHHWTHLALPTCGIQGVEATPFPLIIAVIWPPPRTASKSWTQESNLRNTIRQTDGVFCTLFTKQGVERIRHLPHSKYYAYLLGMITTQPTADFWGRNGFFHQLLGLVLPELNALIHKNTTTRCEPESPVG